MKNLIKKMFRKSKLVTNFETDQSAILPVQPDQELFVNNNPPEENIPKENSFGRVNKFLNYDHFSDGLAQGYHIHCESGMQLYINELKSKFRMEMNALDELVRDLILSRQRNLIDLGDMLPNIKEQLKLELARDEELREELKYQKMMSIEGEGWIAQVLYAFEKGYRKGMLDHFNLKEFSTRGIL